MLGGRRQSVWLLFYFLTLIISLNKHSFDTIVEKINQLGQPDKSKAITFLPHTIKKKNTITWRDNTFFLWYISHLPHPLVGAAGHLDEQQTLSLRAVQMINLSSVLSVDAGQVHLNCSVYLLFFFPFNCWINNLTLKQGFSVRPNVCLSFCIYFTLVRFFLRTQRGVANFVQLVPKTHSIVLRVVDLTC